jgi:hypothetical protein
MLVNDAYLCDRCDRDLGNGDLTNCVVVNWADLATGSVNTFQFCLETCAEVVLNDDNLTAYNAR